MGPPARQLYVCGWDLRGYNQPELDGGRGRLKVWGRVWPESLHPDVFERFPRDELERLYQLPAA